ncbi:DUF2818 family protein [Massilia sp. TS11]|uniref:DUF2818 family protein n=1 Tax=Massilia sp. TS11 TaxID=2908003 RepID=UPI001EDB03BA|nr:DUF2818 family protein [Massilia sp. TS11]MCG2583243.1 DUF2818 family protein [Massilia sp. TS11]
MDVSSASWLVIISALVAANLPFLDGVVLGVIPFKRSKPFFLRLLEATVLYFAIGGLARLLEGQIGTVFSQNWEFYAVTACLFLVLGFPGFVLRYLRRRAA